MAEELNQNILPPQESEAIASPDNTGDDNEKIARQNRINLYNTILGLKEKGFSDVYKNAGFAKFEKNLLDNQEFQDALLYDLQTRGFKIDPSSFYGGLTRQKEGYVYQEAPPPSPAEIAAETERKKKSKEAFQNMNWWDKTKLAFNTITQMPNIPGPFAGTINMMKNTLRYAKDMYTHAVRGAYTGAGNRSIQYDYDPDNVDTKNLAQQIYNINQLDESAVEQEFLKDEGWGKDFLDLIAYTPPAIVESLSSMFTGSGDKVAATTAGYATMGMAAGAVGGPFAGITSSAGAAIMGTRGLQVGMTEAGYNMEFSGKLLEEMQKAKMYDPTAPKEVIEQQLDAAFKNKKAMEPLIKKAHTKAAIISGGTAALTFGLAPAMGSTLSAAESRAASLLSKTKVGQVLSSGAKVIKSTTPAVATARVATRINAVANKLKASSPAVVATAMQPAGMAVAGATEALSQYVTDGKINWKDVAIETTADGAYLNMLSKLADIGNKEDAQNDRGKTEAQIEQESVELITQEDFDNYRKGQMVPKIAAKIMDDIIIAANDATHLNKVAAIDPLYGQLLADDFQKFIKQVEIKKFREIALADLAEINNLTVDQVRDFINPQSASFNQDLADKFETTVESLTQQWSEENDSKNNARVSGQVGGGQESQQAQSDQEESDEEAGDDRILEESLKQERIAELEDLLDQDDKYFAKNNERLLDDSERQDMLNELATIQAELQQSKAKQLTPEQKRDRRIEEGQKKSGFKYSSPLSALTNEGKSILQGIDKGKYMSLAPVKELYDEIYRAYKVFSNQRQTTNRNLTTAQINEGVAELETALNKLGDYISKRDSGQFVREYAQKYGETSAAPAETTPTQQSTEAAPNVAAETTTATTTTPTPTTTATTPVPSTSGTVAPSFGTPSVTGQTTTTTTTTSGKTTAAPVATTEAPTEKKQATKKQPTQKKAETEKQETETQPVKESDVTIKKGQDYASDGVYNLIHNGKVIGRMYYDKSMHNQWIDADNMPSRPSDPTGLIGSNKKEAVAALVAKYNANVGLEAETTTKTETKAKTETKTETKQKTEPTAKTEQKPETLEEQIEDFGVPEQDRKPVQALLGKVFDGLKKAGLTSAKSVGEWVGIGRGKSDRGSLKQAERFLTREDEAPTFKNLKDLAKWLGDWSRKNRIVKKDLKDASDKSIIKALYDHTMKELAAWETVKDGYVGFYDEDIPLVLNPELIEWAKVTHGRDLTNEEITLYHILSSFASPSATPLFDSNIGLQIFDRYLRTGEISAYSETKQATEWETKIVNGKERRFDTGRLKFDEDGNPVMAQIARAYAVDSLEKFKNIIAHFNGDIKKAVDWITSRHSYEEMSEMMGKPLKGPKSLEVHENLTRENGGFGVFALSGPKLGSYVLNRAGEYGTVTKDLWYARTMARLFGEPLIDKKGEVLTEPWATTVEGTRKRKLADAAWGQVANELGTQPAVIQQRMWDFEKKLWQLLGAESSAATTASEGMRRGAEVLSERAKEIESATLKQRANAQYFVSAGKNIIQAIKNFKGGRDATVALTHEIMHPTVVSIIDGARDNNEVGRKYTETIVDEYNKANPSKPITIQTLIQGNEDFKNGKTTAEYRAVQEFIADAWEQYHTEGATGFSKAFQKVLAQITEAFKAVYSSITNEQKLTPELRQMFDQLLGKQPATTTVETTAAAQETAVETQQTTDVTAKPSTPKLPSFAQFDAISENRATMQETKAAFIAEHGQAAYNAMKEISANFTKITKALQEKGILTKKC